MEISYENTEEQYIQLELDRIHASGKHIAKDIFLRALVACVFGLLCYKKYTIDIDLYGYLTESASPVILVYIVCGVLWIILLPILYWKLKSIIITKEIENKAFNFQGNIRYELNEDNILVETFDSIYKLNWNKVIGTKVSKRLVTIKILGERDLILPVSAFDKEESLEKFIKYINEKVEQNPKIEVEQEV